MTKIKDGKLLYHQTALIHLKSIIQYGLLSRAEMLSMKISFKDVADPDIIIKRRNTMLERYVPFHFHPRTVFDYRIRADYPQEEFIYICVHKDYASSVNAVVLPAHPLSNNKPTLYPYEEGINLIDWDVMEKKQGEFGYDPQIRMAECLFEDSIKADNFFSICVRNENIKKDVEHILSEFGLVNIYVNVQNYF